MAKRVSKAKKPVRRSSVKRSSSSFHGLEHDFVLIVGGGFVLLILAMIYLVY